MKSLAILTCAVLAAGQFKYECDLQASDWVNPNTCLKLDATANLIHIRPCVGPTNADCPPTTSIAEGQEIQCKVSTAVQEKVAAGVVVPGMACTNDGDCLSGKCAMGYCLGAAQGSSCQTNGDLDCNPGLYCDLTTVLCTSLIAEGQACTGTNQCAMNTGCNNNVCALYYSLDNGAADTECGKVGADFSGFPLPVGSPPNYSVFCKSGTCIPSANSPGGTCTNALHSASPLPVHCTPGLADQCATNNSADNEPASISTTSTTCIATSYNPLGTTFCASEIGDPDFVAFIEWVTQTWASLFSGDTQYCHTSQRGINTACLQRMGGQYLVNSYVLVKENAENSAYYQGTDVCTVQVFLPNYFSAQQYNAFCDTNFQCASNTTVFLSKAGCIQQTPYTNFNIRPCLDPINSFCPPVEIYQANHEVDCQPGPGVSAPSTGLLPGDLCSSNYQCLSNVCGNGLCLGVANGGLCPNGDSDCSPGLYCNAPLGKCALQLAANSSTACMSSSQCVMNAGCNYDLATGLGVCTTYYSVKLTESVSDCGLVSLFPEASSTYVKYSALCNSGTCALQSGTKAGANAGVCVSPYKSQNPLPQSCNFGPTDCPMVNSDNAMTYGQCSCGMANTKARYCSVDFGDQPWQDLFSWMQEYLSNFTQYASSCHTNRRGLDQLCMMKTGGVPRLMQYQEKWNFAYNYPTIVNTDNCTQQIYNSDYWTAFQYNRPYLPDDDNAALWPALALLLAY